MLLIRIFYMWGLSSFHVSSQTHTHTLKGLAGFVGRGRDSRWITWDSRLSRRWRAGAQSVSQSEKRCHFNSCLPAHHLGERRGFAVVYCTSGSCSVWPGTERPFAAVILTGRTHSRPTLFPPLFFPLLHWTYLILTADARDVECDR